MRDSHSAVMCVSRFSTLTTCVTKNFRSPLTADYEKVKDCEEQKHTPGDETTSRKALWKNKTEKNAG